MVIIGIILAVAGAIGLSFFWDKNEWRIPVLEVSSLLEKQGNLKVGELYSGFKRRCVTIALLQYCLYVVGVLLVFLGYNRVWVLVIACLIGLWLLKAVVGLIRAGYSRKIRLLNYLYSPYVLAWRRDNWSAFTDQQIAAAISEAAAVDFTTVQSEDDSLDSFLLGLCRHTRPAYEAERYPEVLEKLKQQAAEMVWDG